MSYEDVEMREYKCDGHCGLRRRVDQTPATHSSPYRLPDGWIEIHLTESAARSVGRWPELDMQLCPTCFSLATLLLWSPERQLKMLGNLSTKELEDYELSGLFDKLDRGKKVVT